MTRAALWGPRPSQAFAAVTLILLAGASSVVRDLFFFLSTGAIPQGISCLHAACL